MADITDDRRSGPAGNRAPVRQHDEGDGTFSEAVGSHLRAWDATAGSWVRVIVDHASGGLVTSGGASGGGAATIADGADVAQGTTTDVAWVSGAGTVVAILKAIVTKLAGTLTVATHAVTQSGAWTVARSWTLSSATDSVNVGNFPASQAVTGTFFQGTQPVSAAALPLPTGAATSANQPTLKAASTIAAATDTASVVQHSPQRADAANLCVTVTAATGVAATLTIPSAGAGLFHYISLIEIQLYATTARTGGATPVLVTTTNLPGSPVWDFDTAQALGVTIRQATQPATPIKSSAAATATTIVAPIATTGIWRITAYYYAAV